MEIRCDKLTTCNVLEGGETARLDFLDPAGAPVSVLLPFEHAEAIAMTLPHLLTRAVKAQTGSRDARYAFPLGQWFLEAITDVRSFILTLKTQDGFEASYRIPLETSRALGWTLHREASEAIGAEGTSPAPPDRSEIN